ncbi:hypothetical protein HDV00_002145 [Rhizophlyctis rosea]|nr:hypothetical protein HDV00_002145 [Rhizophlyctis rosea]
MPQQKRKRADKDPNTGGPRKRNTAQSNFWQSELDLYLEYRNAKYAGRGVVGTTKSVRPLALCAVEVVAKHLSQYEDNPVAQSHFDFLPPNLLFLVLDIARRNNPNSLTPQTLVTLFIDRFPKSLDRLVLDDLPSARHKMVWEALSRSPDKVKEQGGIASGLRALSINHLEIGTKLINSALKRMPMLTSFDARGNMKLDDTVLTTLASYCPNLCRVNVSMTSAKQNGVAQILSRKSMKIVKMASLHLAGDKFWMDFAAAREGGDHASLTNLKLASNDTMNDKALLSCLRTVGTTLQTLDLSSSRAADINTLITPCYKSLTKLNISLCRIHPFHSLSDALHLLHREGNLRKLSMQSLRIRSSTHPVLDQQTLNAIAPTFSNLTHLSIAQNQYIWDLNDVIPHVLGLEYFDVQRTGVGDTSFVALEELGARCSWKSVDLSGNSVGDDVAECLGQCAGLESVWLGNTRITGKLARTHIGRGGVGEGGFCGIPYFTIFDSFFATLSEIAVRQLVTSCPNLREMDTTGCRGIPLPQRKTVFEDVWKEVHLG